MKTIIRSYAELQALRERSARRGLHQVSLDLPGEATQLRQTERTINQGLAACGCETAAVFLLVGLVGLAAFCFYARPDFDFSSLRSYLGLTGYLSGLVVVGKLTGLALAEWRLQAAIARFKLG